METLSLPDSIIVFDYYTLLTSTNQDRISMILLNASVLLQRTFDLQCDETSVYVLFNEYASLFASFI